MIKRKPLPKDQSKVYVYTQDVVNGWIADYFQEKKKVDVERKKHIDEIKKRSEKTAEDFQRLYMNKDLKVTDFKVNENE